ncbi:hypothetical protein HHI36_017363 [Cryptolaemus montrouzieri]|uniref:Uncharacterized protein n=1 Tax=Cryptolaemus montrouzieri TaxID=559131 RepID=A0ABD2NN41_9CUCU
MLRHLSRLRPKKRYKRNLEVRAGEAEEAQEEKGAERSPELRRNYVRGIGSNISPTGRARQSRRGIILEGRNLRQGRRGGPFPISWDSSPGMRHFPHPTP